MAASAEALLNTLAGGSDGTSESSDIGTEQIGSGASSTGVDQDSGTGTEGSGAVLQSATPDGKGDSPATGDAAGLKPTPEQLYQNAQAAIRETRSENKALKQQLQELTAKIEALAKPLAAATEQPAEPDFLADPKAYVDATKAQLKQLTEKLESNEKQQTEQQKQQQQAQETWNKVIASEAEFALATPDYQDALNHVRGIRAEQIKIEIRETEDREPTTEEIGRILSIQEAQGAAALVAKGKNPSKFYYEYAKTFGYKAKAAASAAPAPKPDKDAVRTMGSGGGDVNSDAEPEGALGILAAAQSEHRAQFKRRK